MENKQFFIQKLHTLSIDFNLNSIKDFQNLILLLNKIIDYKEEDEEIIEEILILIQNIGNKILHFYKNKTKEENNNTIKQEIFTRELFQNFYKG